MMRRILPIVLVFACAGIARAEMPSALVEMLASAEVPPNARAEAEAGGAPVWVLERDTGSQQLTVGGVVELDGVPERIGDDVFGRDALLDADELKAAGVFSQPPGPDDVARYHLPESDLEVLADCEVHACKFKLGAPALEQLGAIDWNAPDARREVDAMVRRRMVELAGAYQNEGRAALGRYVDKPNALTVTQATGMLLDQMKAKVLVETVRTHLADYPKSRLRGARDRLHWNVRDYGYRPVTSIVHTVVVDPGAGEPRRLLAAETLYASHYFYARLQLLGLYADAADPKRSYAVYADRLLFDDQVGAVQRKMLRSSVVDDVRKQLQKLTTSVRTP
jgi:hypothetical protein